MGEDAVGGPVIRAVQYWAWMRKKIPLVLLVAYFLLIYTSLPIVLSGDSQVPTFWVLAVTGSYALLFGLRLYLADILFFATALIVALASIVLTGEWSEVLDRLGSVALLAAAILNGMIFLQLVEQVDRNVIGRILLVATCMIIAGSFLEVFGPLRDISDAFREWAFSSQYGRFDPTFAHDRDLALVGFIRPNLFTSETSNLAKGFLVFSNAWLLLDYTRYKLGMVLAFNVLMLIVTGSLVLVVSLIIAAMVAIMLEKNIKYLFAFMAIGMLSFIVFWLTLHEEIYRVISRLEVLSNVYEATPEISSVAVRMVFPFITLLDVLVQRPLFGVGIGGTEAVSQFVSLQLPLELAVGNNGLCNLLIHFGIVGLTALVFGMVKYITRKSVHNKLALFMIMFGILQTMGDAWTVRLWAYFFIFLAVLRYNNIRNIAISR